jgi:hypothetical protein
MSLGYKMKYRARKEKDDINSKLTEVHAFCYCIDQTLAQIQLVHNLIENNNSFAKC